MITPTSPQSRRKRAVLALFGTGILISGAGLAYRLMPTSPTGTPTATFTKVSEEGSRWRANVQIINLSNPPINGWKVEFDLPTGSSIGRAWDAELARSGQHFTLSNVTYNASITAGRGVTIGLQGSGAGSPENCRVNGVPCGDNVGPPAAALVSAPATTTPAAPSRTTRKPVTKPPTKAPAKPAATVVNLSDPAKKDIAMRLVSAAENSSLNWRAQFRYIQDIGDGRGYTAGIIGFCSGTGDMVDLVEAYSRRKPGNVQSKYRSALRRVNNTSSHTGLDPNFTRDWKTAAADPVFQAAQEAERDRVYFTPSVARGRSDGVRALGQFAYYDAAVVHGFEGMLSIRARALKRAKPPSRGGTEATWLTAFLNERVVEMKKEEAHSDVTRIETAQRVFLKAGNFDLKTPLRFGVYGDRYTIT
jgi:chitosanase